MMVWTYEQFCAGDALQGSASATMTAVPFVGYDMVLHVHLPPTFMPWVDPKNARHCRHLDYGLAEKAAVDRFLNAGRKIDAEQRLLLQRCMREWRPPTADEDARFAALLNDFDLEQAALELSLCSLQ